MNHIKYWADRFDTQLKNNPDDPVKALNFSNYRLMDQVHEEILSCIDVSRLQSGSRILDTGCGTGQLLCRLMALCGQGGSFQYHAVDISQQMLDKTRDVMGSAIEPCTIGYAAMSVDAMGFEDDTFSLVLASESLQYTNPYAAVLDLIRMTRKSGQIVISIPNHHSPFIQKAIQKHGGRFTGLDFEKALDVIAPEVSSFKVKPLVFADNQEQKPYLMTKLEYRPDKDLIRRANRFVISLIV